MITEARTNPDKLLGWRNHASADHEDTPDEQTRRP